MTRDEWYAELRSVLVKKGYVAAPYPDYLHPKEVEKTYNRLVKGERNVAFH